MRRAAIIGLLLTVGIAVAGCGGESNEGGGATDTQAAGTTEANGDQTVTAPDWAAPLLSKAGSEGAAVMASSASCRLAAPARPGRASAAARIRAVAFMAVLLA